MNNGEASKNTITPKLTEDDKIKEYINLLINDDSFEIKTDEQDVSWSNGKKIGTFFSEYHKEIVGTFFSQKQKSKTKTFKARSKIIDYMMSIGGKKIKKIEDSYNFVLAYLNDMENVEDIIRCVSVSMSSDGAEKYENALYEYMKVFYYDEETAEDYIETYMNNSGMSFAMSSEKNFKALIIFNECLNNDRYTFAPSNYDDVVVNNNGEKKLVIGTSKWRRELNKKGEYGAIRNEASLLELIKDNIQLPTLDKRAYIESVKSTSGHDLYALYQLLDPVSKLIVNSEFYIYDPNNPDNKDKDIGVYAILTQDIDYQLAGTSEVVQSLEEYSDDFVKSRYADIDLNNVKPDELDFLKRISTALKDYCIYKFPRGKKYDNINFLSVDLEKFEATTDIESINGHYKVAKYPYFTKLDKMTKYYLASNFDENEIGNLNQYLKQLANNKLNYIQIEQFLNLAIFFKQFITDKLKMQLPFEKLVLDKLLKYFDNIKDFDLFNGTNDNLFLNNFFTKENIENMRKEIESKKIFEVSSNNSNNGMSKEQLMNLCSEYNISFDDKYLEKRDILEIIKFCQINKIPVTSNILSNSLSHIKNIAEICYKYDITINSELFHLSNTHLIEVAEVCRNYGIQCEGPVLRRNSSEIKELMEICHNYGIKPTGAIFQTTPSRLQETIEVCRNYGIQCEGPVLRRNSSEIKELMEICHNYGIKPTGAIFQMTPSRLQETIEVCRNYGIQCEGPVLKRNSSEIKELMEICHNYGIKPTGAIFQMTPSRLQETIEVCRNYGIQCEGPVLRRNSSEIKELMEICHNYGIKPTGAIFQTTPSRLQETIEVCRNYGIQCEGPVLRRNSSEIKELMEICHNYGIKPTGAIFQMTPSRLQETIEVCRNYGIQCEGPVLRRNSSEIKELMEICHNYGIKPTGAIFQTTPSRLQETIEVCRNYGIQWNEQMVMNNPDDFNDDMGPKRRK